MAIVEAFPERCAIPLCPVHFVVFCLAKPGDAEAFAERFGGERLPTGWH
jgi:hypothetical protein